MAKDTLENRNHTAPAPKVILSKEDNKKRSNLLFGLMAFLVAVAVIVIVFGGAFFIIMKNNVNGMADRYRDSLQGVPLLRLALPKAEVPGDPKLMTGDQLLNAYTAMKAMKEDLEKQVEAADKKIGELQEYKDGADKAAADQEKAKQELEKEKTALADEQIQLEKDKKTVEEMIAKGNTEGFKAYFEKIDPETAAKLYADVLKEQKQTQDEKKLSQLYESMDAAAAAAVFEKMGISKIDTVVSILKNMDKEAAAEVMGEMTSDFGAKVTEKLAQLYLPAKSK